MNILLTEREAKVAAWLHEGKTCSDIALILEISQRTVEKHCERIYEKYGVHTRISFLHEHGRVGGRTIKDFETGKVVIWSLRGTWMHFAGEMPGML